MVIRQKKFGNGKLVEINFYEGRHGESYYFVELREEAGNWMPWEIREEDGTRHIMSEIARNFHDAQAIYDEYVRKVEEDG